MGPQTMRPPTTPLQTHRSVCPQRGERVFAPADAVQPALSALLHQPRAARRAHARPGDHRKLAGGPRPSKADGQSDPAGRGADPPPGAGAGGSGRQASGLRFRHHRHQRVPGGDILERVQPGEVDFFSFSLDGARAPTNDQIRAKVPTAPVFAVYTLPRPVGSTPA